MSASTGRTNYAKAIAKALHAEAIYRLRMGENMTNQFDGFDTKIQALFEAARALGRDKRASEYPKGRSSRKDLLRLPASHPEERGIGDCEGAWRDGSYLDYSGVKRRFRRGAATEGEST